MLTINLKPSGITITLTAVTHVTILTELMTVIQAKILLVSEVVYQQSLLYIV